MFTLDKDGPHISACNDVTCFSMGCRFCYFDLPDIRKCTFNETWTESSAFSGSTSLLKAVMQWTL